MENQIETARSLDAILVLCGESNEHSRSNHTYNLYWSSTINRENPLSLVITGKGSGLSRELPPEPEAVTMQRYLLSLGIPESTMHLETEALDTLGNMVFSRPLIDQILSGYISKKVGLVTDRFHMKRSLWTANRVFGNQYDIKPLPTEKDTSLFGKLIEVSVKNAWQFDLWKERISAGNLDSFEKYMKEKHPFHVENAPLGAYKLGIYLLRAIKK